MKKKSNGMEKMHSLGNFVKWRRRKINFSWNKVELRMDEQQHPDLAYFKNFFSPIQMVQSIKRRNDNLEMISFENSQQEPEDVISRRKKKVCDLLSKDQQQIQAIRDIQRENFTKFRAIMDFIKFFCAIKQRLPGTRTDYYSNKTFFALKNASEEELVLATKTMARMYDNIFHQPPQAEYYPHAHDDTEKKLQFLIIPRFLISREKINRLSRDEELQKNIQFLVFHECLGHYNNEANKKMPEETQMTLLRNMLKNPEGREKFKKICSINHGNKFLKSYKNEYYNLYGQTLEYLRTLDSYIKRGKKFQNIKKDLEKMKTEETYPNSSNDNSSAQSSSLSSFKHHVDQFDYGNARLTHHEQKYGNGNDGEMDIEEEELRDQCLDNVMPPMRKNKLRKLMTLPMDGIQKKQMEEEEEENSPHGGFRLKKYSSASIYAQNIILIPPPKNAQI